jgi:hypothetical protein
MTIAKDLKATNMKVARALNITMEVMMAKSSSVHRALLLFGKLQ